MPKNLQYCIICDLLLTPFIFYSRFPSSELPVNIPIKAMLSVGLILSETMGGLWLIFEAMWVKELATQIYPLSSPDCKLLMPSRVPVSSTFLSPPPTPNLTMYMKLCVQSMYCLVVIQERWVQITPWSCNSMADLTPVMLPQPDQIHRIVVKINCWGRQVYTLLWVQWKQGNK